MTTGDKIVLVAACALVGWLYAAFWHPDAAGVQAQVLVAGRVTQSVSLKDHGTITVQGTIGPSELELRDGRIRFTRSPCRGKQCIHSGWLARDGDFAACLPNGVAVRVVGANTYYDAINF